MATAGTTLRRSGFAALSVGLYLAISGFIVFNYFRAVVQLFPYRDRIMGGYGILMGPRVSPQVLLLVCAAVLLVVIFYKRALQLVSLVPAGIRGLVLPVPFYFAATRDTNLTVVLVALGAVLWLAYRPLGAMTLAALNKLPRPILEPIARFWAGILYTALVTRAALPVVLAMVVLVGYQFVDRLMQRIFAPVWDWHSSLPQAGWIGLFAVRLVIGATAPFVLSLYFAWFNWGYDTASPIYGVLVGFLGYFILRMPRGESPAAAA